jgi:hypothetical protein
VLGHDRDQRVDLVAARLAAPWFEDLFRTAWKEQAEVESVAIALENARDDITIKDRLVGASENVRRADGLEQRLAREQREAVAAFENAWAAVAAAFAVLPPIGVQSAALMAAAVLDANRGGDITRALQADGGFQGRPDRSHRALFLAALAELRRSTVGAFRGAAGASPFRSAAHEPASAGVEAAAGASPAEALRHDLTSLAGRYLTHAFVLGALRSDAPSPAPGFFARLLRGDESTAADVVARRARSHGELLLVGEGCGRRRARGDAPHRRAGRTH